MWQPAAEDVPSTDSLGATPFRCQTRKGVVLAGRKFEMVFHFTPETVDIAESHWRFLVPELQARPVPQATPTHGALMAHRMASHRLAVPKRHIDVPSPRPFPSPRPSPSSVLPL